MESGKVGYFWTLHKRWACNCSYLKDIWNKQGSKNFYLRPGYVQNIKS